jgi:hypothetical protein
MYEQLDPLQIPFQNLTQIIPIPSGGILTTLYINAVLCLIMFLIFVFFIIHLPLFNLPEKKRTQRRIKRDFEFIQHGAITSQEPIFTNSETFLNRIKNLFMLMLNSVLAFIPFCFKENKKEFQYLVENYGKEATVYSLFLKEMLWAFIICAFVGMAILFPLHLTGTVPKSLEYQVNGVNVTQEESFIFKTTVSMVVETPWKLYFHVFLTFFFVFIFLIFIARYFVLIFLFKTNDLSMRGYSVKIYGLPANLSDNELRNIFEELYPNKIISCEITWNFIEGMKLKEKLDKCIDNLNYYKYISYLDHFKPTKFLFKKFKFVDAIEFYQNEYKELSEKSRKWELQYENAKSGEETTLKSKRTGHIIFNDPSVASECLLMYSKNVIKVIQRKISKKNLEQATPSQDFKLKVTTPSDPGDILWTNYLTHRFYDIFREIIAHAFMIVVCIFFTTPLALLSAIETLIKLPFVNDFVRTIQGFTGESGNLVFQYLPTLLVTILTSLFSTIVIFITNFAKYKTKSKYNRMIIFRMYCYLILGIFIVPTLTLSSVDGIVKYFSSPDSFNGMLKNLYVTSNGSFFINMILQFATFKNFISLLLIGPVIKFIFFYFMSKTPQQVLDATESAELYFPLEYSYTLLIVCISLCYSLLSPIVLPCTLLYMVLKCLVNRILMYFVFGKKLNPQKEEIDYTSIFSESWLIVKIMFWNLMIFVLYHVIYFGLKISVDLIFISHFILELILLILLIGLYVLLFFFKNWILTKFLRIKHEILDPNDPRIITFKPDLEFTYYDERVEKEQEENLQKNEELKEGEQKPEEIEIKKEEEFIVGSPEISEKTNLMQVKIDYEAKENTVVKGESENFNITE